MKKILFILLSFLSSTMSFSAIVGGSEVPLADPYILLDNGVYYAYGTHSDNGIEMYSSTDLVNWTYHGLALSKNDTSEPRWFWAPEVYKFGDKYYMYYSANERLYVAIADSPEGPFYQHGTNIMHALLGGTYAIDSSLFIDEDGKTYLFFVRNNDGNNIWRVELEDDHITPKERTLRKCISVSEPWENIWPRVVEGPNIVKHNGLYYLTYSANSFESQDYGVGYATIAKLSRYTWTKYDGNPILHRYGDLVGTGHHSIFTDKEGKMRIAFHAHYSTESIHPRCMYIGTMEFKDDVLQMADEPIIIPKSDAPNGGGDYVETLDVDWNVPYLPSARSNEQYDIVYTRTNPESDNQWTMVDYDDSQWTKGRGPIGNTGFGVLPGTAEVGTGFSDVNDSSYSVWYRRHFTLDHDITDKNVYLACGHDDEGAIYLDGTLLIEWANEWDYAYYFKLSPEQASLLTKGEHVFAVCAKNNTGGYYSDCGLYGITDNVTKVDNVETTDKDGSVQYFNMSGQMLPGKPDRGLFIMKSAKEKGVAVVR